jgi:hypothetical protein
VGEALEALWSSPDAGIPEAGGSSLADGFYPYALATIFQYWEGLTDRQMAQATGRRVDLKYAMHLRLDFPGTEPSRLCFFRQYLLMEQSQREALERLAASLDRFVNPAKPPAEVDQIIDAICLRSRAEIVLDCLGAALESIACCDPSWLRENAQPGWYKRYHRKLGQQKIPRNASEIVKLMEVVGNDGLHLLTAIQGTDGSMLAELPEVLILRNDWQRQFEGNQAELRVREPHCRHCAGSLRIMKDTSVQRGRRSQSREMTRSSNADPDQGSFRGDFSIRKDHKP